MSRRMDRLEQLHAELDRLPLEAVRTRCDLLMGFLAGAVSDEQWDQAMQAARQTHRVIERGSR